MEETVRDMGKILSSPRKGWYRRAESLAYPLGKGAVLQTARHLMGTTGVNRDRG